MEFGVSNYGTRLVKIRANLWLSAPDGRVTLGHVPITSGWSKEQTEEWICTQMRERSGSTTLNWFTSCGRDVVFIADQELPLVEQILTSCPEIVVNGIE